MKKRFISLIAAAVVAIVSSVSSFAQAKIDKLVNTLEKDPDVQVTYTERRDPKTKKIIRHSIILSGAKKSTGEILWNAFEQERPNSISVTKQRESFIIKFQDKNYTSSYVLSVAGSNWSLVITKRSPEEEGDEWSYDYEFNSLDGLDLSGLNLNLDLGSLSQLGSLGTLNDLSDKISSGSVTVYDSNGNVIFKSASGKSSAKTKAKKASKAANKTKKASTSISTSVNRSTRTITTTQPDGTTVITSYTI